MSEHSDLLAEAGAIQWEREVRGYNRQQVDEYVAWRTGQVRELESRLSQGLAEIERLRREVAEARESAGRPVHEEISERIGQILKLAADEATAERERSSAEIASLRETAVREADQLRADAKRVAEQLRADSQQQAERLLTAASEESERVLTTARAEAEQLVNSAQAAAQHTVNEANQKAESTVATAMAQAKQQLDDATARAGAVHDGAERRLNLLISRHTETVRRLTEIRDVVTNLVSGEAARGSLEEEVARALGDQSPAGQAAAAPGADGRAAGRRASGITPGGTDGQPAEREREQSDPLGGDRHDTSRYQQADPGPLPVEASVLLSDEARHGGAGDQPRRSQASTSRSGAHVPERALDETAAGGRGLDV